MFCLQHILLKESKEMLFHFIFCAIKLCSSTFAEQLHTCSFTCRGIWINAYIKKKFFDVQLQSMQMQIFLRVKQLTLRSLALIVINLINCGFIMLHY